MPGYGLRFLAHLRHGHGPLTGVVCCGPACSGGAGEELLGAAGVLAAGVTELRLSGLQFHDLDRRDWLVCAVSAVEGEAA